MRVVCGYWRLHIADGLYALFGAPKAVDNPCPAAFAAAKDFVRRVDQLNVELVKEGEAPLQCGLGLHCGEAVVGIVGAIARHRYTATGDAVYIAARLERLTKDLGYLAGLGRSRLAARYGGRAGFLGAASDQGSRTG